MDKHASFDTILIHGGQRADGLKAVTPPIYQTSTFAFENAQNGADCFAGESDGFIYTRLGESRHPPSGGCRSHAGRRFWRDRHCQRNGRCFHCVHGISGTGQPHRIHRCSLWCFPQCVGKAAFPALEWRPISWILPAWSSSSRPLNPILNCYISNTCQPHHRHYRPEGVRGDCQKAWNQASSG